MGQCPWKKKHCLTAYKTFPHVLFYVILPAVVGDSTRGAGEDNTAEGGLEGLGELPEAAASLWLTGSQEVTSRAGQSRATEACHLLTPSTVVLLMLSAP